MIDLSEFEFDKVPVHEGRFVLPAGEYVAALVSSEQKQTANGFGLLLTFQVLEGEHKGRTQTELVNLWNNKEETVRIAKESMARLMRAAGQEKLASAEQLFGIPVVIVVKVEPHWKTKEATSTIKGYKSLSKAPQVANKAAKADEDKEEDGVPW